jgi:hypothetical protein
MEPNVVEIEGERALTLDADGPELGDGRDLVEAALNAQATLVAVPAARLGDSFFHLRSGVAGEILQKAANYRLKLAIVGDISGHVAASDALRDFVVESNRGRSILFVADLAELRERIRALRPSSP